MTNDKTTLNGSLDELGEIMANNLVTMGINDADPSDGLTTLAGKILSIETEDNVSISTTITSNISIPSAQYYIDDTLTVTGTLTAGTLDNFNLNGLQGATIYMYNVGLNGDANDLMGQGTTNANGEFSIQGTFHKADYISIKLKFNGTEHFSSSYKIQNSLEQVQKKPISLPQNIENKWSLTPTTCIISVGSQYAGVPVSLFLDGSSYQTVNIDNSGNATFNISNLSDGSYLAQIKVVNHNKYADAQSNTFSLSSGVDIYLNPQLTLTSTKDILSYADNETATITAELETPGLNGEPIQGIPVSFTYDHQHHDVNDLDLGTYYKIEGSSGVLKIGDATNYVLVDFDNSLVQKSGSTTTYTFSEPISVTFENGYFLAGVVGMEEEDYPNIDFTNLYSYIDQNNGVITITSWLGSQNTNANGLANITYESQGLGDISVTARIGSIVTEIFAVEDCYRYDTASSDKTSSYASPIVYRGSGSGQWNYNSSYGYYGTISGSNEVMIPLDELTGEDDFTIEFDAKLNSTDTNRGIGALCAYENNNNYSRISCNALKLGQRVSVNGSATESESNTETTVSTGDLLHYKFTVSNNEIVELVMKGTTRVGTRTISYTPTSSTKFGFALVWSNTWTKDTFLKNIKVKSL